MKYKLLTSSDYINCMNLLSIVTPEHEIKYAKKPTLLALKNCYFNDNESLWKVFGGYDNNDMLVTAVFVRFSSYDRSWNIRYFVKRSTVSLKEVVENIDFVMDYAESSAYYRWYGLYLGQNFECFEKVLFDKSSKFKNYYKFTEEIIPDNRKSSFEKYWIYFQEYNIFQKPMIIRMYSCNQSQRNFNI